MKARYLLSSLFLLFVGFATMLAFNDDQIGGGDSKENTLLKMDDVVLDNAHSARFIFNLERDEDLMFDVRPHKETALDDIQIIVNDGTPLNRSNWTRGYHAPTQGAYSVTFKSNKDAKLDLKVQLAKARTLAEGTTYEVFHIQELHIAKRENASGPAFLRRRETDDKAGQPKFYFKLKKGDEISVTSSDPSAAKVNVENLVEQEIYGLSKSKPIIASRNIDDYALRLYGVKEKSKGLIGFIKDKGKKIFGYDNTIQLSNLVVTRRLNKDGIQATVAEAKEKEKTQADKEAAVQAGADKAQADNNAFMEKMLKKMEELGKRPDPTKSAEPVGSATRKVYRLSSFSDFLANRDSSNMRCIELKDFADANAARFGVYRMFVNSRLYLLFADSEKNGSISRFKTDAESLVQSSSYSSPFFAAPADASDFDELVEFAILDEYNKDLFQKGEEYSFTDVNRPELASCAGSLPTGSKYYLCLRNNNAISPVEVYFIYQLFNEKVTQ
ncbi:MAG: hypothetical protein RLZZ292_636 [Bacteroidota bacterium]